MQLSHALPLGATSGSPNSDVFSFTLEQPVLKNAGRHVVMSSVLLARLEANRVSAQTVIDLSKLLVNVTSAYWKLFQARGEYLVRQQQVQFADQFVAVLKARQDLDAEENSIALADANRVEQVIEMQKAETAMLGGMDIQMMSVINAASQINPA